MSKRLPVSHYIKNLKLVERNSEWLRADGISNSDKAAYYGHIVTSYMKGDRSVKYLGNRFYFDNIATPLNLQNYPYEISKKILSNMDKSPRSVLDIGGNIGQFSITMNRVLNGKAVIDVFEPNQHAMEILKKNIKKLSKIRTYQYGLGEKTYKKFLYFDPLRSGIGSVIKDNAGATDSLLKQEIDITNDVASLTKRSHYDLVKIDVEGYEFHAIKGLKNIIMDYLFIELSGQGRTKDYSHSDMLEAIRKQWGGFDIYYCGGLNKVIDTFDILIKFRKA